MFPVSVFTQDNVVFDTSNGKLVIYQNLNCKSSSQAVCLSVCLSESLAHCLHVFVYMSCSMLWAK